MAPTTFLYLETYLFYQIKNHKKPVKYEQIDFIARLRHCRLYPQNNNMPSFSEDLYNSNRDFQM